MFATLLALAACGGSSRKPEAQGPVVRKVILLQGIDTAGGCDRPGQPAATFNARREDVVKALSPLGARPEDVIEFSYAGSYVDCASATAIGVKDVASGADTAVYTPRDTCGGVHQAAERLSGLVRAVSARYPTARFDLVAHSLGGLVATTYVSELKGSERERIHAVVLLDSPVLGLPPPANPLSSCAAGDASWQDMLRGSSVTHSLKDVACREHDIRFTAVLATKYIGDAPDCATVVHTQSYEETPAPEASAAVCNQLPPALEKLCLSGGANDLIALSRAHSGVWVDPQALQAVADAYRAR